MKEYQRIDLNEAPQEVLDGVEEACHLIAERIYNRKPHRYNFLILLKQEANRWISEVGEPALGKPYTNQMREIFISLTLKTLSEAFDQLWIAIMNNPVPTNIKIIR